ncbi:MAG: hypothetical protein OEV58_14060 [Gammaproteobacteria bacterium]|nr:hypothetical protein [Gammaproteobacteria bacterium]
MTKRSKAPIGNRIKEIIGIASCTEFEKRLLAELKKVLPVNRAEALDYQLRKFNKISRYLKPATKLSEYGYTEFHCSSHGKPVLRLEKKISDDESEVMLAKTNVLHAGGEIEVEFWIVYGRLFSIRFKSENGQYYPEGEYSIQPVAVLIDLE